MIQLTEVIVWVTYLISSYFLIFWLIVFIDENPPIKDNKKLDARPSVTVGIPAYNEEDSIVKTIESVMKMDYPKELVEIIVVNDGSKDRTKEMVEDLIRNNPDRDIKIVNKENEGKGKALNKAISKARGEFFAVLDADSFVSKDSLKKMLPYFYDKGSENVAVVLPLMKVKSTNSFLEKMQWCEYLINFFYKKLMSVLDCVHVAPGPFSLYRRAILQKVGGFDENNMTEDLEISLRLQKKHYKLVQTFDTQVYTLAPKTFKEFYKQRNRWYKGSLINSFKYRGLIFNRKYEEFGMMHMPRIATAGILVMLLLALTIYRLGNPLFGKMVALYHINFDIWSLISNWSINFHILDLNYSNIFFALFIFTIGMIIIALAHQYTRESWKARGRIAVPVYLILYSISLLIVWAGIAFDLLRGKIQKW